MSKIDFSISVVRKEFWEYVLERSSVGTVSRGLPMEIEYDREEVSTEVLDLLQESFRRRGHYSVQILNDYQAHINNIVYVGPLRRQPERLYPITGGRRGSVGVEGEFTSHILYHNEHIRQEVNKWFGEERFDIPYELSVREFGDEVSGKYAAIVLYDKNRRLPLTIADVGFGVNQILPVIVEAIASHEGSILCIEQPEIHLHPKLQANIAELMIETIADESGKRKQWIVETHSEMLIRRIQTHIQRKTIQPEDVSVLYVDPPIGNDKSSVIEVLELDRDGKFIDSWPNGFFDEGVRELLGYGDIPKLPSSPGNPARE